MSEMEMEHECCEPVTILQELDLGQHTLFLFSDGSLDLLANDEQTPYLADNMICLDCDETYRLYISLQAQFQLGRDGEQAEPHI